jgi:hypothetical protein
VFHKKITRPNHTKRRRGSVSVKSANVTQVFEVEEEELEIGFKPAYDVVEALLSMLWFAFSRKPVVLAWKPH